MTPSVIQGTSILIIEDAPEVSETLALYFESLDAVVVSTRSPREGLAILARDFRPDVIVSEWLFPNGETARVLLNEVKANPGWAQIPVLILSVQADFSVIKSGAKAWLKKPCCPDQLIERIVYCLGASPLPLNSTRLPPIDKK